jgi:hypothetical protein
MADAQNEAIGTVEEVARFKITDGKAVLEEALNNVMNGTMKPDAAKAVVAIIQVPAQGLKLMIEARKAGFSLSPDLLSVYGLNGIAALPAATEATKKKN